jgi:hypothetical protein
VFRKQNSIIFGEIDMKQKKQSLRTLTFEETVDVFGGSDSTAGHAAAGGLAGASFGQGAGTLAGIMNGAATGARWGRWGGGIGLVAGILIGGAYGALSAGG